MTIENDKPLLRVKTNKEGNRVTLHLCNVLTQGATVFRGEYGFTSIGLADEEVIHNAIAIALEDAVSAVQDTVENPQLPIKIYNPLRDGVLWLRWKHEFAPVLLVGEEQEELSYEDAESWPECSTIGAVVQLVGKTYERDAENVVTFDPYLKTLWLQKEGDRFEAARRAFDVFDTDEEG